MNQELLLFARSIWAGILIVAAYDILRIWRKVCRHGTWWIAAEDLIYWCVCGVYLFSRMYQENDGIIRIYAIGGILLGIVFYHYSVSDFLVKYIALFFNKIKKILKIPLKGIAFAIKWLKSRLIRVKIFLCKRVFIQKVRVRKKDEESKKKEKAGKPGKKKKRSAQRNSNGEH